MAKYEALPDGLVVHAFLGQPGGRLVHDVLAHEDDPHRATAEFWLQSLAGDRWFTDGGNADDWLGFCGEFAKQPEDDFEIVEKALSWYASRPMGGGRAEGALEALDRLVQDWAERNANAVRDARDAMRTGWD